MWNAVNPYRARAAAEISSRRSKSVTFTEPIPPNTPDLKAFLGKFYREIYENSTVQRHQAELQKYPDSLALQYQVLVPDVVSYEDFWQRHDFRCDLDRVMEELKTRDAETTKQTADAAMKSVKNLWSNLTEPEKTSQTTTATTATTADAEATVASGGQVKRDFSAASRQAKTKSPPPRKAAPKADSPPAKVAAPPRKPAAKTAPSPARGSPPTKVATKPTKTSPTPKAAPSPQKSNQSTAATNDKAKSETSDKPNKPKLAMGLTNLRKRLKGVGKKSKEKEQSPPPQKVLPVTPVPIQKIAPVVEPAKRQSTTKTSIRGTSTMVIVSFLVVIAAVIAARLLIPAALCAPVVPFLTAVSVNTTLATAVYEAPWWSPPAFKTTAFMYGCSQYRPTSLKYTISEKRDQVKLVVKDVESGSSLLEENGLLSFHVLVDKIVLDRKKKSTEVELPWQDKSTN